MNTADLIISKDLLENARMSPQEMATEIAVYLYQNKRLTMGQAKRLAGLNQIEFQNELAARNVFIHYEFADVLKDVKSLNDK